MEWIPPEIRENRGEIELALGKEGHQHKKKSSKGRAKLPQLIDYNDLRGDLQVHSNYSDGKFSIEEMAQIARIKFGLKYIAITIITVDLQISSQIVIVN